MEGTNSSGRNAKGHFIQGNQGGPGRPKGSLNFLAVIRKHALRDGVDLEDQIWKVCRSMVKAALAGDTTAASLLLSRIFGSIEKGAQVEIQVNAAQSPQPVPEGKALGAYVEELHRITKAQGLIPDDEA